MVGAFHHTNDECEGSNRSAILHTALHNTEIVPCNQQTLHAWLLTTLPPTVQTPCKNSIAFPNASLAVTRASDATFMPPAPSDHHMREATTALLSLSATLGPQLMMVVEVLRALSGLVRRNARPLQADESCKNGAQVSCDKCLRAGWGGFEHRDRISTYGEYYGSEEEACGGTFPTFLDRGANDKKDLAFKVEGDDHFVDPTPNRVDHCNLTL